MPRKIKWKLTIQAQRAPKNKLFVLMHLVVSKEHQFWF
jgi:hypothetical protein